MVVESTNDARRRVDSQLLLSSKQIDLALHADQSVHRSCIQAALLQMALALEAYLIEITQGSMSDIHGLMNATAEIPSDFRAQQLGALLEDSASWLSGLVYAIDSVNRFTIKPSVVERQNVIVSTVSEELECEWWRLTGEHINQMHCALTVLIREQRDLSSEW